MKNEKSSRDIVISLSPIIQSNTDSLGNGIYGFTIQFSDWIIENHVYPYTPASKKIVYQQIRAEYSSYDHGSKTDAHGKVSNIKIQEQNLKHQERDHEESPNDKDTK